MRFENLTPDRIKTRDTLVARHLAWHRPISRRTFLGAGVGAFGAALGAGLLRPVAASAAPGIGNVLPIPSTLEPFPGVEIHVQVPPFSGVNTDPSTVWNFQGASGIAFIDTSVTRTHRKTGEQQVLPSTLNHMTFMQGMSENRDFSVKKLAAIFFLLVTMVSGCSVLANTERFYRDHPLPMVQYNDD